MPPFWARPRFVLSAILLYLLAHLAIRMAMGSALSVDDAEQALFSQHFAWAYRYKAPPLFTWALTALGAVMPVDALSIGLVRYGSLAVLYICIYFVARRLIADPRLSALSVYSFAALGTFAEASHRNLTHSTAHAALLALGWYVFLRLAAAPVLGWYLVLGAVFGLGIVAKWNFVIFAVALPLACLASRERRGLVLNWRIVPAALVAAAIVLPTVIATLRMGPPPGEDVRTVLGAESGPDLTTVVDGTLKLLDTAIIYALPLLPIVLVLFAMPLWRGLRPETQVAGQPQGEPGLPRHPNAAFVGMTMAIGMLLLWAVVLGLGATEFKVRYVYPALLILPVWLFMTIERGRPSGRMVGLFALIMVAATVFVAGKRLAEVVAGFTGCSLCVASRAYPEIAAQLEQAGYDGAGTILVSGEIGGNLRVIFPEARIVDPAYAESSWPAPKGAGPCLLAWRAVDDAEAIPASYAAYLTEAMGGDLDTPHSEGTTASNGLSLAYRLYPEPNGACR